MALKSLFILVAIGIARGQGKQLEFCGSAPYYASEYTCYNTTLCPRLYGQPTLPCSGACYSPDMYRCGDGGQLQLLPALGASSGSAFRLEAHSSNPALNNRLAEVCNLQFNVGADAETCVYCYNAPPQFVCSSYRNETVLLPSGAMVLMPPLPLKHPGRTLLLTSCSLLTSPVASIGLWIPRPAGSEPQQVVREALGERMPGRVSRVCGQDVDSHSVVGQRIAN
jgi:hypothetical protein